MTVYLKHGAENSALYHRNKLHLTTYSHMNIFLSLIILNCNNRPVIACQSFILDTLTTLFSHSLHVAMPRETQAKRELRGGRERDLIRLIKIERLDLQGSFL